MGAADDETLELLLSRAGHGRGRTSLELAGLTLGEEKAGDFGSVAHISDPDGNQITLAEPPGAAQGG